jgi:hypothetical protein
MLNNNSQPIVYDKPFTVKGDGTIKAFAVSASDKLPGDTAVASVSGLTQLKAVKAPATLKPGLAYQYFEADVMDMNVVITSSPKQKGIAAVPNESVKLRKDKYGLMFEGYIQVEKTGGYQFFTKSDDGSILLIDDQEIVNNDGNHGSEEKVGRCILEKGFHRFKVVYFDSGGGNDLSVSYQPFGMPKIVMDAALFFHNPLKP